MAKTITPERYDFLMLTVFGNDNAKELLEYLRDGFLSDEKSTNYFMFHGKEVGVAHDPNGIDIIKAMAKLQLIQTFLDYNREMSKTESTITQGE